MSKPVDDFRLAPAATKADMIGVAYLNLGHRFRVATHELQTINSFLLQLKDFTAQSDAIVPDDRWHDEIIEYIEAGDTLSDTMIENAQLLEQLEKAINFYNKKHGITSTTTKSKGV